MRAAVLAVGSELLSTDRLDTNSLRLAAAFERQGVELIGKAVVGDDEQAIAAELGALARRAELVVVTGGLGPTADDVTREACAAAFGRELVEDPAIWLEIERRFASFGRVPAANNRRQARVPAGAVVLRNHRGTAPGLRLEAAGATFFLLPGVPHELEALIERELSPWLAAHSSGGGRDHRTLRIAMRPESEVDEKLEPAYREFGREWITVLAAPGEVRVRLLADGEDAVREARLATMAERVRLLLGSAIYGEGDSNTLENVVGGLLTAAGRTVATAESCTGGLLAERLTRIPGSSRYYPGGVVTYSNEQKMALLGVAESDLAAYGAVSEPVARQMALGVCRRFATDFGVGVTGIAGPGGGSKAKPVGTVHVAVAGPDRTEHRHFRLPGDRELVRAQAAQGALDLLRRVLEGGRGEPA